MAEISASIVKELRERTGAGMMDCKKALVETGGDYEKATDWLRAKGLAAAAKKASRTAAEGLVGVAGSGTRAAVVEINSETDFVAKNEQFQAFVAGVSQVALNVGDDRDTILSAAFPGGGGSVQDVLTHNIATIGEQQAYRRAAIVEVSEGAVASYIHNAAAPDMGKIGVLVGLQSSADASALVELGRGIAMHIAAMNPLSLTADDADPAQLERERAIAEEKAKAQGKPADITAKMVDGAVRKYAIENSLMGQVYVRDGKAKVSEFVAAEAKRLGADIKVTKFVRFQLGEGIEKAESDFAAEVAAAAGV
ncbi:translation elongation factor Ts [Sandaracinobacteroides saxicola]|uniref:Elongation factor Ts n=1 Tax=Sandaracinobacteroides saxicola TaxID=2759707 RepID=A0A7G5IKV9_9SPHN|nr:translation elongation factor Ts [Sandaracinobacteroides saxicola]QMW24001.1 elongation factor Ts [Sandaracinobacteroides saxicola]